jgi:hypothetical protein
MSASAADGAAPAQRADSGQGSSAAAHPDGAAAESLDAASSADAEAREAGDVIDERVDAGGLASDGGSSLADGEAGAVEGSPDAAFVPDPDAGPLGFVATNVPPSFDPTPTGDWTWDSTTCPTYLAYEPAAFADDMSGGLECQFPAGSFQVTYTSQQNRGDVALFTTQEMTVTEGTSVEISGLYPMIIVALGDVTIAGTLSVAGDYISGWAGGFGSATNPGDGNGPGAGQLLANDGGTTEGAGGGGYCGLGGDGSGAPGSGGATYGNANIDPLVGGSSGGLAPTGGDLGGSGGGGGALQIVSATSITVTGTGVLNAGGGGAVDYSGGGGAGGAILLEAPVITIAGRVVANGGGGSDPGVFATGGCNASTDTSLTCGGGGTGGAGGAGTTPNGYPGTGGGGGGGGVGRIRFNTAAGAATFAPGAIVSPSLATTCASQGTLGR